MDSEVTPEHKVLIEYHTFRRLSAIGQRKRARGVTEYLLDRFRDDGIVGVDDELA